MQLFGWMERLDVAAPGPLEVVEQLAWWQITVIAAGVLLLMGLAIWLIVQAVKKGDMAPPQTGQPPVAGQGAGTDPLPYNGAGVPPPAGLQQDAAAGQATSTNPPVPQTPPQQPALPADRPAE